MQRLPNSTTSRLTACQSQLSQPFRRFCRHCGAFRFGFMWPRAGRSGNPLCPAFGGIDPSGFRKEFGVWIWGDIIICATLSVVRLMDCGIASYTTHRNDRTSRAKPFIVLTKTVHEKLLAYGKFDDQNYIEECLKRLDQSEDGIWVEDKVRYARSVFIVDARKAFQVRRSHGGYRNDIERSETTDYLDNSKERLIAALRNQRLPKLFYPPGEEDPSWWERMVARVRYWLILLKK